MKINNTTWWIIGAVSLAGLGAGAYFLWKKHGKDPQRDKYGNLSIKGSESGIEGGVQTTREGQGTSVSEPNWENPFAMNYQQDVMRWVAPKTIFLMKKSFADQYAKQLKEAWGGAWYKNDDEDAVKDVFTKKVADKVHVSCISKAFYDNYKKDLYDYLANFLSQSEMEAYVIKPVQSLPNYRIAN